MDFQYEFCEFYTFTKSCHALVSVGWLLVFACLFSSFTLSAHFITDVGRKFCKEKFFPASKFKAI